MNRYEIASHTDKRALAHMKGDEGPTVLLQCLISCIQQGVDFDATNVKDHLLEQALVKVCKRYSVPLVTSNIRRAQLIRIAHSFRNVYIPSKLPKRAVKVICFPDVDTLPPGVESMLNIRKSPA